MNSKAVTLSVIMAFIAMFFVNSYIQSIEEKQRKDFGTEVSVLVAKNDIKEMETIDETMLNFEIIPKKFIQPGAISFEPEVTGKNKDGVSQEVSRNLRNDVVGLVAVVPLKKGEQITRNKLTEPSIRTGLAPQVAPGRRAVAVPVNEVTGVAKLVKPGDRVDLIAVMEVGINRQDKVVKTILQDVVVLAVGSNVTNNVPAVLENDLMSKKVKTRSLARSTSFSSVTVEVTSEQAQMLALLTSNQGNVIVLALRNNDDSEQKVMPGMALTDVLGAEALRGRLPAGGGR